MNNPKDHTSALYYVIAFKGHLDERWHRYFNGLAVQELPSGETLLSGAIIDQSALFGMLSRIRDLDLPLLLVKRGDYKLED